MNLNWSKLRRRSAKGEHDTLEWTCQWILRLQRWDAQWLQLTTCSSMASVQWSLRETGPWPYASEIRTRFELVEFRLHRRLFFFKRLTETPTGAVSKTADCVTTGIIRYSPLKKIHSRTRPWHFPCLQIRMSLSSNEQLWVLKASCRLNVAFPMPSQWLHAIHTCKFDFPVPQAWPDAVVASIRAFSRRFSDAKSWTSTEICL